MSKNYFAHISSDGKELLIDHLNLTGELAFINGQSFHQGDVCRQLGLFHDLGKHTKSFQDVLQGLAVKKDHAIVSAMVYLDLMQQNYPKLSSAQKWMIRHMALIMAAHHSYLYTVNSQILYEFDHTRIVDKYARITRDKQKEIAVSDEFEYKSILQYVKDNHLFLEESGMSWKDIRYMSCNELMLYVRMLYSCLVDADYAATCEYMNPGYLKQYFYHYDFPVYEFLDKLAFYHDNLVVNSENSDMNQLRNRVYHMCTLKSQLRPGFFTLTAPTGTGKTLALMQFALSHAKLYHKRRIFVILPYLSIINQNATIYKSIFGENVVLVDDCETEYKNDIKYLTERWSSPIIVTTSVRFFQTLFTSKAKDVRKLHNVCNSVIVFDECQTLPSDILNSSMELLQSLVTYYECTVLLSTATLPSYQYRVSPDSNVYVKKEVSSRFVRKIAAVNMIWNPIEIMDNPDIIFKQYEQLKSTNVVCNCDLKGMTCNDLLDYYESELQVIYIFNTIRHAENMYMKTVDMYGPDGCYLLTSHFCAADKQALIQKINDRLMQGLFVRLIATQCVEAGVDFDFPAGARECAPLDSVIQAAGRVNRSGKRNCANFLVFQYENHGRWDYPSFSYKEAADITKYFVKKNSNLNLYDLSNIDRYFEKLYHSPNYIFDNSKLIQCFFDDNYQDVDKYARIIKQTKQMVYVVHPVFADDTVWRSLILELKKNGFCVSKHFLKKLMPYTVSMYTDKMLGMQLFIRCKNENSSLLNWFLIDDGYDESGLHLDFCSDDCIII